MSIVELGILGLYFLTLVILAVMGFHRYVMVWLYLKHKERKAEPRPLPAALPRVTVQLPIFNEMYVVDRLLASVAALRYPKDKLEIQVLDDSTDETTAIASRAVERYRAQGFDIHYLHRSDRTGFKAGALEAGLARATGEFVLIFDADFVAPPDNDQRGPGFPRVLNGRIDVGAFEANESVNPDPQGRPPVQDDNWGMLLNDAAAPLRSNIRRDFTIPAGKDGAIALTANWLESSAIAMTIDLDIDGVIDFKLTVQNATPASMRSCVMKWSR